MQLKKRNIVNIGLYWQSMGFVLLITPFLLALSTVFVIDTHLANGVVSGKYFWFYGSMVLVAVATVISLIITDKQRDTEPCTLHREPCTPKSFLRDFGVVFRFSLTDVFVLLFAGSVFLSSCVINNASANATKLTLFALLLVLYFCLRMTLTPLPPKGGEDAHYVETKSPLGDLGVLFIILTGLVEAVWGLLQLYGFQHSQHGLFKLTGSFFNPGPYSGYLAVVFPMALYYFELRVKSEELRVRFFSLPSLPTLNSYLLTLSSLFACIVILLVLPAAMSRAAWLAAIAGSTIVLIRNYELRIRNFFATRHPSLVTRYLSLIAVTILVVASLISLYFLKKDSADGRLLTWKVSLTALVKHPLGVGLGHFPSAYSDTQAAYFASGKASETEEYVAGNPEYGFNEFLQIGIESGIVSLLLFIGILVSAFRGLLKAKNWGVMGSLVALLVFSCFSYPFSVLPFLIVFVFLLAMSEANGTRMTQMTRINADKKIKSVLISLICVICVLLVTLTQYPVYKAYKQWNNSRMFYHTGMYKEAVRNYEPLYPYLNDQIQFLFEYGRSLSQSEQPEKSNEVLQQATQISCDPMLYNIMGKNYQALKEYDLAEKSLLKSTYIVPNRLYPYYLLMKLYVEKGDEDKDKAREAAGIVLTKEPKVQSQAVKEMREEARRIKN